MYVRQDVRVFVRVLHMLKLSRFFPPRLEDYVLNVKNLIYQIVIERHGFVSVEEVGKKKVDEIRRQICIFLFGPDII